MLRYWKLIGTALILVGLVSALALHLRNDEKVRRVLAGRTAQLDTIRIAFRDMGEKVSGYDDIVPAANKVGAERARYKREREEAQAVVDVQSDSIRALEYERADAMRQAVQRMKQIAEVTRQRDAWKARAKSAETRTERLSAEEELRQCEEVLDRLYQRAF